MNYTSLKSKIKRYLKRYYYKEKLEVKKIRKALNLIKENRIIVLENPIYPTNLFYVKGQKGNYYVFKNIACTCYGFSISIARKYKIKPCYHILACSMLNTHYLTKRKTTVKELIKNFVKNL
jgi:predicted nucleic acid-binding Zn finger protein